MKIVYEKFLCSRLSAEGIGMHLLILQQLINVHTEGIIAVSYSVYHICPSAVSHFRQSHKPPEQGHGLEQHPCFL